MKKGGDICAPLTVYGISPKLHHRETFDSKVWTTATKIFKIQEFNNQYDIRKVPIVLQPSKKNTVEYYRIYSLNFLLFFFQETEFVVIFPIERGYFYSSILISYRHFNFLAYLFDYFCFQSELLHFKISFDFNTN